VVVIPKNFLKTFYDDLDAADIEREDSAKRVLDLHALRHTYGSRLVAAGVDIKTVQTLMRHSTPTLTLGIYVHSDKKRMRDAVASLPRVTPSKSHIAIA
jgi:integrase